MATGRSRKVPLEERFWKYVQKTDGCWLWTGGTLPGGYGLTKTGEGRRMATVHRISYEMHHGPIPKGLCVLHRCDVRNCVNPAHLFLGTKGDNNTDRTAKGRSARGERSGSSRLTADAVREIRNRYAAGGITVVRLGAEFGVHFATVARVINRITWRHV
jgi:hypothetical protein